MQADLIHLGAKFAPCMRKDAKIMKEIEKGREKERETACCIRNDDSGCVQSSQADCSVSYIIECGLAVFWQAKHCDALLICCQPGGGFIIGNLNSVH
jgi:hypothetical protein